jgi:5'-nucleotidase (lipoprotein e(P4) family)
MKKIGLISLLFVGACTVTKQTATTADGPKISVEGKLFSLAYQQKAAEYKALCFQAYNLAHLRLDQALQKKGAKPLALITDIDETVLDNSDYDVHQAINGRDYDQNAWYEWTSRGEADTVPGAPSFLKYAASKGVTVFYITNRDEQERPGTMKNLKRYGLPNTDNDHLVMRQGVSSKEARRQQVTAAYDVVLFLGDNLADFSSLFDKKPLPERNQNANSSAAQFGDRFIVLPNPVYGDWETALYNYNRFTPVQKDSAIRKQLKTY